MPEWRLCMHKNNSNSFECATITDSKISPLCSDELYTKVHTLHVLDNITTWTIEFFPKFVYDNGSKIKYKL